MYMRQPNLLVHQRRSHVGASYLEMPRTAIVSRHEYSCVTSTATKPSSERFRVTRAVRVACQRGGLRASLVLAPSGWPYI